MPITADRAEKACRAVVTDQNELGQLLGLLDDLSSDLASCRLGEADTDDTIVGFLRRKLAGECRVRLESPFGLLLPACMVPCIVHSFLSPCISLMSSCSVAVSDILISFGPPAGTGGGGGGGGAQGENGHICTHVQVKLS